MTARSPRRLHATLAALAALLTLVACGAPTRGELAPATLAVASDLDNPPFAYVGPDGEPAGRDVEMMERVAGLVGRELVWRRMPFDELLHACERGRHDGRPVDVVCATLGVTAERARRVDFTRPYFETFVVLVVRTGDGEPTSADELAGLRVAAAPGTTSEDAVRERLPDAVGVFTGGKSTVEALLAGQVDAAAMDGPAARARVEESDGALTLVAPDRGGYLAAERYALALPKGHRLRSEIDEAIDLLGERGELAELDRRFGVGAPPDVNR